MNLKDTVKSLAFTSLLITCSALVIHTALRLRYKGWTPAYTYSEFVAPYPEVKENYQKFGFDDKKIMQLLAETYPATGWEYTSILQFQETPRSGEYVNVSGIGFRRNSRNFPSDTDAYNLKLLSKENNSIIFLGGSTAFGYGLPDSLTIPAQLEKNLKNTKVFNFGRGYYYSDTENKLLTRLLKYGARPKTVIFLDGINERCELDVYDEQMKNIFKRVSSFAYSWEPSEFAKPLTFLTDKIRSKINATNAQRVGMRYQASTCGISGSEFYTIKLRDAFQKHLNDRRSICERHDLQCITFIQPLPGLKNIDITDQNGLKKRSSEAKLNDIKLKNFYSKNFNVIDLSSALEGHKSHAYIDTTSHYSPMAAKIIADTITNELQLLPEKAKTANKQ